MAHRFFSCHQPQSIDPQGSSCSVRHTMRRPLLGAPPRYRYCLSLVPSVFPCATSFLPGSTYHCIPTISIGSWSFGRPRGFQGQGADSSSLSVSSSRSKIRSQRLSRAAVTLAPFAEEGVENRLTLPSWDKIWMSRSLDRLEQELTR